MKSYKYTITFDVAGRIVVLDVFAACVGNAKCVARGQLSDAEYSIAKLVSVFAS
jgi:hypothetical protein